ncbi:MAG: hypothetical protein Q9169_002531 [Polycauliona sp. 2 TL-2023]
MSILGNPKLLYFIRIAQLLLGLVFLVLICYDGTHRAWWTSINGPLAVGVISSIFTFAITAHSIFTHHRSNPFSGGSATYTIARLAAEVLVFLLWVASAALMLRPREGCDYQDSPRDGPFKDQNFCFRNGDDKDHGLHSNQPIVTWTVAIVVSLIEASRYIEFYQPLNHLPVKSIVLPMQELYPLSPYSIHLHKSNKYVSPPPPPLLLSSAPPAPSLSAILSSRLGDAILVSYYQLVRTKMSCYICLESILQRLASLAPFSQLYHITIMIE